MTDTTTQTSESVALTPEDQSAYLRSLRSYASRDTSASVAIHEAVLEGWARCAEAQAAEIARLEDELQRVTSESFAAIHAANERAAYAELHRDGARGECYEMRKLAEAAEARATAAEAQARELAERVEAIINWCDFALKMPQEFDSHGVRNLTGPAFDDARAALTKARAAGLLTEGEDHAQRD